MQKHAPHMPRLYRKWFAPFAEYVAQRVLMKLAPYLEIEMATWKDVQTEVTQETTLVGSMASLLAQLQQQVTDAGGNQDTIDQIFATAQSNVAAMTAAVVANTPAASVPTGAPASGASSGSGTSSDASGSASNASGSGSQS